MSRYALIVIAEIGAHPVAQPGIQTSAQMSGPTNSRIQLPPGPEIQDRPEDRLVKNFRISKKMRPFVGRMRMRLKDFDWTKGAIAVQLKRNCEDMKGILAKKSIPEAKADHAIAQTLEAATDHQLQRLRQKQSHQNRVRSAGDVGKLIARLEELVEAIAKATAGLKEKAQLHCRRSR